LTTSCAIGLLDLALGELEVELEKAPRDLGGFLLTDLDDELTDEAL
jgi:hypothetical protein